MNKHPFVAVLALLLTMPLFSVAAAQGEQPFSVGMNSPVQLDPALGTNDPEILFNRTIYDYLIDVLPNGELNPQLATDWTISDDGLTYTFNLLGGVTFHDGSPFTAASVVFSFNRLRALESPAIGLLGDFEVAAEDNSTVVFTLPEPNADFLFGVASRWSFILPDGTDEPNVIAEGDDPYVNFIGTGPFILTDYQPEQSATFTANEDYWVDGQPAVDGISYVYIEEPEAQIGAVRSGTVDFIFKVPFDRVAELEETEGVEVVIKPTNQHPVIRLRSDDGSLGENSLVRQAFKLATDRELLNIDLFDGRATVGNNNPIGPLYSQFYAPLEQAYDPEQACALLDEAGFPDGLGADQPIEFYVVDAFNYEQMAVLLQDQWSQACIEVDILIRPENIYYGDNEWITVDLGVTGWASRPIPQQYLTEAYVTSALPDNGGFNESHWSNEAVDALVARAAVTADLEARAEIYNEIATVFNEEGPVIIPFFAPMVGVVTDRVEGLDMHPFPGRTDFRAVSVTG